jgi:small subunit ribosomal protein S9
MTETRTYATGKRKTAVARVWLLPGTGNIKVNQRPADDYFVRETNRMVMRQSLELLELLDKYDVNATVVGGGHSAQAEAMRHGIARALCEIDVERRASLKRAGFLTRDARKKERKKYGQPGARKRF